MKKDQWLEPSTGVVHLDGVCDDGEFTLCGLSFDAPSTEDGEITMVKTDKACNCDFCWDIANRIFPYLKQQLSRQRRIERKAVKA